MDEEAKVFLIGAIAVGAFLALLRPACLLFVKIYVLLGGII